MWFGQTVNTTFNVNVYDTISNERTEDFTLGIKLSARLACLRVTTAPSSRDPRYPLTARTLIPLVLSGSVQHLSGGNTDEVAVTLTGSLAALADDDRYRLMLMSQRMLVKIALSSP